MRILIVGTGSIGRRHVANLQVLRPDVELVLLRREAGRDAWSNGLNALIVSDLEQALEHKPDGAVVATPSALHINVLPGLIRAGIPLYVEKPVVTTLESVNQLRELLSTVGYSAPTLVGCNLRFMPSLQVTRDLVQRGVLGTLVRASFEAGQWLPDWRPSQDYRRSYSAHAVQGGGVVFDLIHELDAARWILGNFTKVKALTGRYSGLDIQSEDCAAILLGKAGGGPIVTVGLDYVSRQSVRRYHFVGTDGSLNWDLGARRLEHITATEVRAVQCGEFAFDSVTTYRTAMQEFLNAVALGTRTSQDISDGLDSAELAIGVTEAARL